MSGQPQHRLHDRGLLQRDVVSAEQRLSPCCRRQLEHERKLKESSWRPGAPIAEGASTPSAGAPSRGRRRSTQHTVCGWLRVRCHWDC